MSLSISVSEDGPDGAYCPPLLVSSLRGDSVEGAAAVAATARCVHARTPLATASVSKDSGEAAWLKHLADAYGSTCGPAAEEVGGDGSANYCSNSSYVASAQLRGDTFSVEAGELRVSVQSCFLRDDSIATAAPHSPDAGRDDRSSVVPGDDSSSAESRDP